MKLQRENNQSAEFKSLRNHQVFRIVGTEEQAKLIEAIDTAIGNEVKCYVIVNNETGEMGPSTWQKECSDYCADYVWGTGCGWIVEKDDVEEFKALWKKHKKLCK